MPFPRERMKWRRTIRKQADGKSSSWTRSFQVANQGYNTQDPPPQPARLTAADLSALQIRGPEWVETPPGKTVQIFFDLINNSSKTLYPWPDEKGIGFVEIAAYHKSHKGSGTEKRIAKNRPHAPVPPGGSVKIALRLQFPSGTTEAAIETRIIQSGHEHGPCDTCITELTFLKPDNSIHALACFPADVPPAEHVLRCPVLEKVDTRRFPWVHHQRHGWLFLFSRPFPDMIYAFYPGLGPVLLQKKKEDLFLQQLETKRLWRFDPAHRPEKCFLCCDSQKVKLIPDRGYPFPVTHPDNQ